VYDAESKTLEPWVDAPGEISTYDWRDYLGQREYVFLGIARNELQSVADVT
jgi:hypothetical protein